MFYAISFTCLKKWSTDLWPLIKRRWNSCNISYFTKLATSHSIWNMQKEVTIASITITKIISFLDTIIYNSAFRTSPETVTLLTKQFPRWSLITLWFNDCLKKLWAKLIIYFLHWTPTCRSIHLKVGLSNLSSKVFL